MEFAKEGQVETELGGKIVMGNQACGPAIPLHALPSSGYNEARWCREKKMPGIESGSLSSKKHLGTKGFLGGPAEYRLNKSNSFPSVIRADQQGN